MPGVSVVILNYNGRTYLEQFLPSVIKFSPGAEVVVADNASTDDSIDFLKSNFPGVRLIAFDTNHGFAGGYNLALSGMHSTYCVLLNSDVEVGPDWLEPLTAFLDAHQDYAACQPKILDHAKRDRFEYAGASGGFVDLLGYPFCRGRIFDTLEEDKGQYNDPADIFWATGACMLIRTELFRKAGGFDEDFFAHMEEIDLCWRLHGLGYKIAAVPRSQVYHVGGGTLSKYRPQKTYLNFRNNLTLLFKNLPWIHLVYVLPARVLLDWAGGFKLGTAHSFHHLLAVIKAQWHFLAAIPHTFKKRKKSFKPQRNLLGNKILILEYFFLQRKTFRQINNTR